MLNDLVKFNNSCPACKRKVIMS